MQNDERKVSRRFGGGVERMLPDGMVLDVGEIVQSAGPGKGMSMLPWALWRYERVLRLRPAETWLLARLMAHAWTFGGEVYPSLRKTSLESGVSRVTLQAHMAQLKALGLVRPIERADSTPRGDLRKRYDVSPVYRALALCIIADPSSRWARRRGSAVDVDVVRRAWETSRPETDDELFDNAKPKRRQGFGLDFDALARIAKRTLRGGVGTDDEDGDE